MTDREPSSAGNARGTVWVLVPFVVAVVGTVVMLFTNSANALKVALIAAMWAAAAGLMLIDKLRRDRDVAVQRAADREAELTHAREQLAQVPAAPAKAQSLDDALLRDLQNEIKALRTQLEELRGEAFAYEPAAVRAAARRIPEIERSEPVVPTEPETPREQKPGPSTEDTAKIAVVKGADASQRPRTTGAPTPDAISGRLGQQPTREQPNPLSALISEREREARAAKPASKPAAPEVKPAAKPAVAKPAAGKPAEAPKADEPKPYPKTQPTPPPAPATAKTEQKQEPTPAASTARGGRRRRDERGEKAVSVAELLARQNANNAQNKDTNS